MPVSTAQQKVPGEAEAELPVEGLPPGFGSGAAGRVAFWIAVAFALFQLYATAYGNLPSQVVRAMHVGFLLLLGFGLVANLRATGTPAKAWFWTLGLLGFGTGLYNWVFYIDLIRRSGFPTPADLVVGSLLIVLVFEGARRLMGLPLTVIAGVFLAYCFFGQYLPPPFIHRGYHFEQIIEHFAFGTEGIYGMPVYVSAAYIFIFVVFASFLERAGMIRLFTDVALGLVGSWRGGPAQVAVLSSALMGTISGSGVANVVTSGQFTIPLMKRFGYPPGLRRRGRGHRIHGRADHAAGDGRGGLHHGRDAGRALCRGGQGGADPGRALFRHLLLDGASGSGPRKAQRHGQGGAAEPACRGAPALAADPAAGRAGLPALRRLHADLRRHHGAGADRGADPRHAARGLIGPVGVRMIFWVAIGIAAAAFLRYGVDVLMLVIGALVVACAVFQGGRATIRLCIESLAEGAKNALPVGIACAIVGIVIGTMTLTGIASTFIGAIIAIGRDNLFLSLLLTMLTCLVLGMGIPTIPNYIITSSLAGPALLALDVPLMVSHMFVFYFGILADLTPPVALACFAAAPIARAPGLQIALQATKLAAAGFVVPFMAVYTPALMLQDGGPIAEAWGYPVEVLYILLKVCLAIGLWGAAVVGFLRLHMRLWERVLAAVAAACLLFALPLTDEVGFALAALVLAVQWWRSRTREPVAG